MWEIEQIRPPPLRRETRTLWQLENRPFTVVTSKDDTGNANNEYATISARIILDDSWPVSGMSSHADSERELFSPRDATAVSSAVLVATSTAT
jgi:hypothetical protein